MVLRNTINSMMNTEILTHLYRLRCRINLFKQPQPSTQHLSMSSNFLMAHVSTWESLSWNYILILICIHYMYPPTNLCVVLCSRCKTNSRVWGSKDRNPVCTQHTLHFQCMRPTLPFATHLLQYIYSLLQPNR